VKEETDVLRGKDSASNYPDKGGEKTWKRKSNPSLAKYPLKRRGGVGNPLVAIVADYSQQGRGELGGGGGCFWFSVSQVKSNIWIKAQRKNRINKMIKYDDLVPIRKKKKGGSTKGNQNSIEGQGNQVQKKEKRKQRRLRGRPGTTLDCEDPYKGNAKLLAKRIPRREGGGSYGQNDEIQQRTVEARKKAYVAQRGILGKWD